MIQKDNNTFTRLLTLIHKIEDGIVVILLSSMLGFAVLQIILRNFFQSGIHWSDSFLRILVLWLGLIGAMIASRDNKHININILSKYLPEKLEHLSTTASHLFTAIISAIVTYYSFLFILMEKESGDLAFANIPLWLCESIIPFAFLIISIRYFIIATNSILNTNK